MDHITATLQEYLDLVQMNVRGRPVVEGALRARALQEISALDTRQLAEFARRATLKVARANEG